jgi:hypothetical protein
MADIARLLETPIDVVLVYCAVLTVWCAGLFGLFCATDHPFLALVLIACFLVTSAFVGVNRGRLSVDRYARRIRDEGSRP